MLRRTLATVGLVVAAVAVLLSGGPSAQEKIAQEKITFATDWKAQAEHGGFYQALATGLYKKHGLDVTIRMGGPGSDTQQLLAAGAVDMALGSNSFYPMNLVQAGAPVRAVMTSFQKDPQILMTHPRDDIKSIADMKGKPIFISATARSTFWVWLKGKYGFTDDQIRSYTFNMAPWLLDKTAIQQGYLSSEPYQVKIEGGVEPQVYLLADAGYPSYSALVLASQKLIDQKPDVVQAFVDATIEGWYSYLYGDPAPGNALIRKDNPEMTDGTIAYGIAKMKEYGIADSGDAVKLGIGAMTAERWKTFFDTMVAEGVYPADLDHTKAYTTGVRQQSARHWNAEVAATVHLRGRGIGPLRMDPAPSFPDRHATRCRDRSSLRRFRHQTRTAGHSEPDRKDILQRHGSLRDVDLTIGRAEFVSLLGPSGCGKSTILRLIAGLGDLSSGRIEWAGGAVDAKAEYRLRLSGTDADAVGDRGRQRLAAAEAGGRRPARRPRPDRRSAGDGPSPGVRERLSARAVRRHEDACVHRPRADHKAVRSADGRTLRLAATRSPEGSSATICWTCGTARTGPSCS